MELYDSECCANCNFQKCNFKEIKKDTNVCDDFQWFEDNYKLKKMWTYYNEAYVSVIDLKNNKIFVEKIKVLKTKIDKRESILEPILKFLNDYEKKKKEDRYHEQKYNADEWLETNRDTYARNEKDSYEEKIREKYEIEVEEATQDYLDRLHGRTIW